MRNHYRFDLIFSVIFSASIVVGVVVAYANKWIDAPSAIAGLIAYNFSSIAVLEAKINRIDRKLNDRG